MLETLCQRERHTDTYIGRLAAIDVGESLTSRFQRFNFNLDDKRKKIKTSLAPSTTFLVYNGGLDERDEIQKA